MRARVEKVDMLSWNKSDVELNYEEEDSAMEVKGIHNHMYYNNEY